MSASYISEHMHPSFEGSKQSLIPNDQLSLLPPLPDTPWHERQRRSDHHSSASTSPQKQPYTLQAVNFNDDAPNRQSKSGESIRRSASTRTTSEGYPVLSTRQGGMNTPRGLSPVKRAAVGPRSEDLFENDKPTSFNPANIPLPDTPSIASRLLSPDNSRVGSTSFNMLAAGDASLIGDCRPPTSLGHLEDSFDLQIEQIRPLTGRKARISLAPAREEEERFKSPNRPNRHWLAESTLLPNSPRVDLMGSTNALSRVDPPWKIEPSPTKATIPRSVSKTKRTFPASSSGQSLASVGEEREIPCIGDASTLLPVSPAKMQHLLQPQHMLQNEDLSLLGSDGHSIFLPRPISTVFESGRHRGPAARTSSRSPVKQGDVTLDLKDVMAGMNKPKRQSGGEMSFVDLLHGQHQLDAVEELEADETFIPANLRPARHLIGRTHTAPRSRQQTVSDEMGSPSTARKSRRRSKSLSETVQQQVPLTMRHTPAKARVDNVSTPKHRLGMLPTPSKRVSLSAGALPMPTSASHKTMLLPRNGLARPPAVSGATTKLPSIQASTALPKPRSGSAVALSTMASAPQVTRPTTRPTALSSRSAAPVAKSGLTSRPAVTTSSRASFKPVSAAAPLSTHSQLSRPSARPAGLPRPGPDSTARSAPVPSGQTREFGGDVASRLNGTSRLAPSSRIANPGKMSSSSALPGRGPAVSAATRAMSTPAGRVVGTKVMDARKTSVPPTRVPTIPQPVSRASTSTTSTGAESKGGKATMEDIRARLSRLQSRQAVKR